MTTKHCFSIVATENQLTLELGAYGYRHRQAISTTEKNAFI
jgi:hypothetical protein